MVLVFDGGLTGKVGFCSEKELLGALREVLLGALPGGSLLIQKGQRSSTLRLVPEKVGGKKLLNT